MLEARAHSHACQQVQSRLVFGVDIVGHSEIGQAMGELKIEHFDWLMFTRVESKVLHIEIRYLSIFK